MLAVGFFFTTCLLALALAGRAVEEAGRGARAPSPFTEVTVKGEGPNKILLLRVAGIISCEATPGLFQSSPSLVDSVRLQLEKAQADPDIKAVVMQVDSPGGTITGSDIIYNRLLRFKRQTRAKIVVLMGTVAASGGFYISMPAHFIMAHPTTLTGSIGVLIPSLNLAQLAKKIGVTDTTIKSGKMKDTLSMWREMREDERLYLQALVDEMQQRFVNIVAENRPNLTRADVLKVADGRIFTGAEAQKLGLVDGVGYLEDAIEKAKSLAGVKQARLVRYRRRVSLLDVLEAVGEARARPVSADAAWASSFSRLAGSPLYLWLLPQAERLAPQAR